ncbi:GlxA family transcriptional regulator [Phyllobacterium sp. OV277]|uniref:GlxA family transcriptional regulator n=1 Tax=Phyllobacterium sp. OV277 TaxID=1882772 RepID=UPI00087E2F16|nr:GlxA family transcriptional regulator [Phyllobacterium sp. OV277]SDN81506.1 transcriptional regulator, AraC family with amidase-like domain [Phyllobacterium sp. OV277]
MRTISLLAMPGVQLLDVSGPMDVFAEANVQSGRTEYELQVVGIEAGPIRSSSGVRLLPDRIITDEADSIDTMLVAGCPHAPDIRLTLEQHQWLRSSCLRALRFGSVCSGAFILAAAGLLDGRRVTTHWAVADTLTATYPTIHVDADALHVRDGPVRTAAGVTAGLDMALALVEEDLGRDIALKVAGQLVMFFKRPGGQMQFSRHGEAEPGGRSALQEVQRWVAANPGEDHSVASLAQRTGLSPRHFARIFQQEVGITPAIWVETARITAARNLLENGHRLPKQVAVECGFADADTLRRAFVRHVGVTPAEYRRRYL